MQKLRTLGWLEKMDKNQTGRRGFFGRRIRLLAFSGAGMAAAVLGGPSHAGLPAALWPYSGVRKPQDVRGELTGAGSSFAAPVYLGWSVPVSLKTGIRLNYQSVGSSAGVDELYNGLVEFAGTDKPVSPAEVRKRKLYQFPAMISGVVLIVNLPGAPAGKFHLTGSLLADIFAGKIIYWDDPALTALNPGIRLPHIEIGPVHRADGSGTTYIFTSYLSLVSPSWKKKTGAGSLVEWEGGAGARGNDGVAALVRQTQGAIGYVEYAFAAQNHLNMAALENASGEFVTPDLESFEASAAGVDWTKPGAAGHLLNAPGAGSWPITAASFAVVPCPGQAVDEESRQAARRVAAFFVWGLKHGGRVERDLGYVGLPTVAVEGILSHWPSLPS